MVARGQKYVSKTKYILYQPEATKKQSYLTRKGRAKVRPFRILAFAKKCKFIYNKTIKGSKGDSACT